MEMELQLIVDNLIICVKNLIFFNFIPLIWWFCRHRKKASYFTWLGFKKPKIEVKWWIAVIVASMIGQLDVSIVFHIVMFSFTFIAGLFMGFINEKICNGSIWASILLHGTVNFINSMFVAFGVF